MGRTIHAEEHLRTYLASLAKSNGYAIGLILGQSAGHKDYIVHLAKTPPPLAKNIVEETLISPTTTIKQDVVNTYTKSIKDIPVSWVADHAKHVTRMLPGGMWVLGIFVAGPDDVLDITSNIQKLKSILDAIYKTLSINNNKHLHGNNQEEKLILNFNSVTQKYICKSIDIIKESILKPAEWKFQKRATKWYQLEAIIDFDRLYLIHINKNPETIKRQLQNILANVADLIDSSIIVIEGEVRCATDTLQEIVSKKKKDNKEDKNKDDSNSFQVNVYIPCSQNVTLDIQTTSCSASIRLIGQLVSRTFLHHKASITEANMAVKQDIIRSLASRLEMHWDSLIEEENSSPEEDITLHEPPRRVLIALPENKITLSDYLFPGEGPEEALLSLRELLDLQVQQSQVQKEIELQANLMEFYCQSDINNKSSDHGADTTKFNSRFVSYIGLGIAFFIVIIGLIIHKLII